MNVIKQPMIIPFPLGYLYAVVPVPHIDDKYTLHKTAKDAIQEAIRLSNERLPHDLIGIDGKAYVVVGTEGYDLRLAER